MILVDSSVWIDFFENPRDADLLQKIMSQDEDFCTISLIKAEVLAGFSRQKDFLEAKAFLSELPILAVTDKICLQAASLYRDLRRRGITIRGLIDCIIAQTALEHGAILASFDKDFSQIAKHSKLKLLR